MWTSAGGVHEDDGSVRHGASGESSEDKMAGKIKSEHESGASVSGSGVGVKGCGGGGGGRGARQDWDVKINDDKLLV